MGPRNLFLKKLGVLYSRTHIHYEEWRSALATKFWVQVLPPLGSHPKDSVSRGREKGVGGWLRGAGCGGPNQPGHHQEETHKRDIESAWAISAPETTGTHWRL